MEHTCQGMTLGDHSKAICTICGADLSKPSHNELLEAIERVRKIHTPFWLDEPHCSECHSYEVDENYASYPCPTIRALDGETDEA
jgi:uncharacterized protein with PIN domain